MICLYYLDGGPGALPDLLDLGAPLADEGAALRGRHDQPQADPTRPVARPGGGTGPVARTTCKVESMTLIDQI